MKRLFITALAIFSLVSVVSADIQAPPASEYTSSRKLGRAISNILYGFVEIPTQIARKGDVYGRKAGFTYGLVNGTQKGFKRLGWGFYELFTFHCPTYKGTFKPPYNKCGADWRVEMNPSDGLSEFPPELGFESYFYHSRTQQW